MENKQGWGIRQKGRLKSQGIRVAPSSPVIPRPSETQLVWQTGSDLIAQVQTQKMKSKITMWKARQAISAHQRGAGDGDGPGQEVSVARETERTLDKQYQ